METSYKKMVSLLVIYATLFLTCQKSAHNSETNNGNDNGLPTSAETKPQYDNTSFGVYKGVVIGSSGIL